MSNSSAALSYVYLPSFSINWKFTHPIFESDFDCLTGKNRLHAQHSPIHHLPLINQKNQKNLKKVCTKEQRWNSTFFVEYFFTFKILFT